MPKKCQPAVAPISNRGKTYYRVTYPTAEGRKREVYSTKAKATARLRQVVDDARRFGETSDSVTATQRADAAAALALLAGKATLTEAARFFMDEINRRESGRPLGEAVETFVKSRLSTTPRNVRSWRAICSAFVAQHPTATTTSITRSDVQNWLDGQAVLFAPRTVTSRAKFLSCFFSFCVSRGWATANPCDMTMKPKVIAGDVGILTPEQAAQLLEVCPPPILPAVTLRLFCGIRLAEVQRLDWSAVDITNGTLTIGAGIAKTASRRVCPIPENTRAWLAAYAQQSGAVWPQGGIKKFDQARRDAGLLEGWPHNAHRHSAISYKLASTGDLSRTSYESGNSPAIIQRHYNGLACAASAATFYSITPASSNIIAMAGLAG